MMGVIGKTNKRQRSDKIVGMNMLEAQIIEKVYEGRKTVRSVHESMMEDNGYMPYTTIMAAMTNMSQKGLLKQDKKGRAYMYVPVQPKEGLVGEILDGIARTFFSGDIKQIKAVLKARAEAN
jgi:predicted transcriptional regulator